MQIRKERYAVAIEALGHTHRGDLDTPHRQRLASVYHTDHLHHCNNRAECDAEMPLVAIVSERKDNCIKR